MEDHYFVYMLRCADDTLYTGITTDPPRRLAQHNAGTASKCTKARRPVDMVYVESSGDRSLASKREAEIKKYTREKKLQLIAGSSNIKGEIYGPQSR